MTLREWAWPVTRVTLSMAVGALAGAMVGLEVSEFASR
jgi:hypothetical protein